MESGREEGGGRQGRRQGGREAGVRAGVEAGVEVGREDYSTSLAFLWARPSRIFVQTHPCPAPIWPQSPAALTLSLSPLCHPSHPPTPASFLSPSPLCRPSHPRHPCPPSVLPSSVLYFLLTSLCSLIFVQWCGQKTFIPLASRGCLWRHLSQEACSTFPHWLWQPQSP